MTLCNCFTEFTPEPTLKTAGQDFVLTLDSALAGGTGLGELHRAAWSWSVVLVVPWQVEGAGAMVRAERAASENGCGGSNGPDHDGRTTWVG